MTLLRHTLLQILTFFAPATLATLLFQVNPYVRSSVEEFAWYRCGFLGVFSASALRSQIESDVIVAIIISTVWFVALTTLFSMFFNGKTRRTVIVTCVNLGIGIIGTLTGGFLLFASMQ